MARKRKTTNLKGLEQAHATTRMIRGLEQRARELREKADRYDELAAEIKNGLLRGVDRES